MHMQEQDSKTHTTQVSGERESLYERYAAHIFAYVRLYAPSPEDAEDVTVEVFVEPVGKRPHLYPPPPASSTLRICSMDGPLMEQFSLRPAMVATTGNNSRPLRLSSMYPCSICVKQRRMG